MSFSCCAVQLFCWICLIFSGIFIVGFAMTIWEAMISESQFCTRAQLLQGAKCAEMTRSLEDALLKVNKTVRFLRPPSAYRDVVKLCETTEKCLEKITCEDGHDFVSDVKDTLPSCEFYKFYVSLEFKECAGKLLSRSSNETCLDTLFNAKHLIRFNRCEQWRDIQPCVHDLIKEECDSDGNSTSLAYQFGQVANDFYRGMNCEPRDSRVSSNEDYEILGLPMD